jgi:hypothetical protein
MMPTIIQIMLAFAGWGLLGLIVGWVVYWLEERREKKWNEQFFGRRR